MTRRLLPHERKTPLPRAFTHGEIADVRRKWADGYSQAWLAKSYNVSLRQIGNLVSDMPKGKGYLTTEYRPAPKPAPEPPKGRFPGDTRPAMDRPGLKVRTRSYALLSNGFRLTVSHGCGEAEAESMLDAMVAGEAVAERGVETFGKSTQGTQQ